MDKVKRYRGATAAFVIFVGTVMLLSPFSSEVHALFKRFIKEVKVKVVNTVDQPVPVDVTGMPIVDAQQSGNWNVGINNDPTSPVPVRDADEPARQPFATTEDLTLTSMQRVTISTALTVPANRILVIEHVSANSLTMFSTPPGAWVSLRVTATTATVPVTHVIGLAIGASALNPMNDGALFALSQPIRIYADPGTDVGLTVSRNFGAEMNVTQGVGVHLSGHFVDS